MSVMMTMRLDADPKKLEEVAAGDPEGLRSISEVGKRHGVIAHRFYGAGDHIMVVDEWPDEASAQAFFGEMGGRIQSMFQAVGVQNEPRPEFWRKLDTHDEVGWGA